MTQRAISASIAGSSAWSGSRSWVWWKADPSQRASPTRNASVPAAVARPVVSVSMQTRGASTGGWPGRRASRSRSTGISTGGTSRRTRNAPASTTTSAPSTAASRAARTGLRRPANGARAGSWSGPIGAPPDRASVARRFARRRSRVTGPAVSAVTRLQPRAHRDGARRRIDVRRPPIPSALPTRARPAGGAQAPCHPPLAQGAARCMPGTPPRTGRRG